MLSFRPRNRAVAGVSLSIGLAFASLLSGGPLLGAAAAQSPEITIELSTNGSDSDNAPGQTLSSGDSVTWQYLITVNGPTTMYDVIVSDDSGVTPNCDIDADGGLDGSNIHPGPLEPGQSFGCSVTGSAQSAGGQTFASTAMVRAFDFDGVVVYEDNDLSHYTTKQLFIANPNMTINAKVNGADGDTSPGPYIAEGSLINWSYIVTNTGNVPLSAVTVTTPSGVSADCGSGSNVVSGTLAPGGAVTCTGTAAAAQFDAGLQSSVGAVNATAVHPDSGAAIGQLSAQDPHNYTPVRLPAVLAFTGPSESIALFGLALTGVGLVLISVSRRFGRRRRLPMTAGSAG